MKAPPRAMSQNAWNRMANPRVHLFVRRVHFRSATWHGTRVCAQQAGAARLDAAIEVNLKELGYGG